MRARVLHVRAALLILLILVMAIAGPLEAGEAAPPASKTSPSTLCGDVNNDGLVSIADLVNLLQYLWVDGSPPPVMDQADVDDHYLVTMVDFLYLCDLQFRGGSSLNCPSSLPPLDPFYDTLNVAWITPVVIPAGSQTAHVDLYFTCGTNDGFFLPLRVRIGGVPADTIRNITLGEVGSQYYQKLGRWRGNGLLSVGYGFGYFGPVTGGTYLIASFTVASSTTALIDRPVSIEFVSLPPTQDGINVNMPVIYSANRPYWASTPGLIGDGGLAMYAAPTIVHAGKPVFFSAHAYQAVDSNSWHWDFGDGTTADVQNPVHVYDGSLPGPFDISVTADLQTGGKASTGRAAYISLLKVRADFIATPARGGDPLTVTFNDLTEGNPTMWLWDFGDPASGGANSSTLQNPVHVYTAPGSYSVCLWAGRINDSDEKCYLDYVKAGTIVDLALSAYAPTTIRRGFDKVVTMVVRNEGTVDVSNGKLRVNMSGLGPGMTFVSSTPAPNENTGTELVWNLPTITWNVDPLSGDEFRVAATFHVSSGSPGGSIFAMPISIDPISEETVLWNNTVVDSEEVIMSIDPNDKQLNPRGCGPENAFVSSNPLNYRILFENKKEATASAVYVVVIDTLHPDFDWGTLRLGPASHEEVMDFSFDENSGEMIWFFDNIMLPPNVNPPEGEGFVSYSIAPKLGLAPSTQIPNRAHIRFDYEPWLDGPEAGPLIVTVNSPDANSNSVPDACEGCCVGTVGNVDCDGSDGVDVGDLTVLIDNLFISFLPLCCSAEANCDGDAGNNVDIGDLTALIDNLFITFTGLPICQ